MHHHILAGPVSTRPPAATVQVSAHVSHQAKARGAITDGTPPTVWEFVQASAQQYSARNHHQSDYGPALVNADAGGAPSEDATRRTSRTPPIPIQR